MNRIFVCLSALLLSVFVGCAFPNTSGMMVEKGRVNIEDPAFASNIEVIQDMRERTPEGFLHAQVMVKNLNRTDYRCQYRFEWIRKNGMIQTHANTFWEPKVLHGRMVDEMNAVCPVKDADDFRLKIRRKD